MDRQPAAPGGASVEAARVFSADPDLRVAGFAVALSLLTGIVFGLVPALQSTRPDVFPTLKSEAGNVVSGSQPFRFRKGLVIAQVALSLLLLIGAGLFTRSLMNLKSLDPGFQADSVVAFTVDPSLNGYGDARKNGLQADPGGHAAEPGVKAVSMADLGLLAGNDSSSTVAVEGYTAKEEENMNPSFDGVGPGFFQALGIPLVSGREFNDADAAGTPKVAIVNQFFAKYFFGDQDPIGRRMGLHRTGKDLDITIVGLVRDGTRPSNLKEKPRRMVYRPYAAGLPGVGEMTPTTRPPPEPWRPREARLPQGSLAAGADANLPVTDHEDPGAFQIRGSRSSWSAWWPASPPPSASWPPSSPPWGSTGS